MINAIFITLLYYMSLGIARYLIQDSIHLQEVQEEIIREGFMVSSIVLVASMLLNNADAYSFSELLWQKDIGRAITRVAFTCATIRMGRIML